MIIQASRVTKDRGNEFHRVSFRNIDRVSSKKKSYLSPQTILSASVGGSAGRDFAGVLQPSCSWQLVGAGGSDSPSGRDCRFVRQLSATRAGSSSVVPQRLRP